MKRNIDKKERTVDNIIKERLASLANKQYRDLSEKIKKDLEAENSSKFDLMQAELNNKSNKVKEFNKLLAENKKLEREKNEAFSNVDLEVNKKVNELVASEKIKIKNSVESDYELRIRQLQKQLDDQKKLTSEQQRKLTQGSMQLQGEVQEQAIEDWIRSRFPTDEVVEIKKGANGADCIQYVYEKGIDNCGSIYYESKNTKTFNQNWIQKFKIDIQKKNVDIGVMVTKTLPKHMKRMGLYKGIYVCTYEEFKGLSPFLREFLIHLGKQKIADQNIGDKKSILYKYLNSKEFKSRLELFVETFNKMNDQLEDEMKRATIYYEKRRGSLDVLKSNIFSIIGRASGIVGTPLIENSDELLDKENSMKLFPLFQPSPKDYEC